MSVVRIEVLAETNREPFDAEEIEQTVTTALQREGIVVVSVGAEIATEVE